MSKPNVNTDSDKKQVNYKALALLAIFAAIAAFLFLLIRISPLQDSFLYLLLCLLMCIVREETGLIKALEYYVVTSCSAVLILGFPACCLYIFIIASWPLLKIPIEAQAVLPEKFTFSPRTNFIIKHFLKVNLLKSTVFFCYGLSGLLIYRLFFLSVREDTAQLNLPFFAKFPGAEFLFPFLFVPVAFLADYLLSYTLAYYRCHRTQWLRRFLQD